MNKITIDYYKILLFLPFLIFILINVFSIFYMNISDSDEGTIIQRNKDVLEAKGISVENYGLLLAPLIFFWLFGISSFAWRISQIFFLFIALLAFSKLKLSPKKKIMGLFLLATSPFIIPGKNEANFLPFFVILPFVLLDGKEINSRKIFLSSLILGFGITIKLVVLYFALPFLVFYSVLKKLERRKILILLSGLVLGFSPFLVAEAVLHFPTLKYSIGVLSSEETFEGYKVFDLFSNSILVLLDFKNSLNLIPYDLRPSHEFFILPSVRLSTLFLSSIYFSLFFLSSFILIKKRSRLELILPCLSFIFLLQFSLSVPRPVHFYFLFPFVVFLILEWLNEKHLVFLIIPLIAGGLLTYEIIKNLPNEEFFPVFAKYHHELLSFLKTLNSSVLITPLSSVGGFRPFLNFKEIIVPVKPVMGKWEMHEVDKGILKNIDSLIEKNESLSFVFPSSERKTLKERLIYRTCYSVNTTDYSRSYPCYDATEIIKNEVRNFGKLKLIRIINDSNGIPVYEIFNLVYTKNETKI